MVDPKTHSSSDGLPQFWFSPEEARDYLEHDEPFAIHIQEILQKKDKNERDDLNACTCHRKLTKCSDDAYCWLHK